MKLATNIQMKKVGGLGRVFALFASYVRRSGTPIEILPLAIGSVAGGSMVVSWEPYEAEGTVGWSARMSSDFYKNAVAQSRTVEDLRRLMSPLVDAYKEKLAEARPDAVLINGTYFRPWCLLMAARELGIPRVLQYHGSAEQESVGSEPHARDIARAIERDFADDGPCIFPSELARSQAGRSFSLEGRDVHVIPNGVPEAFFSQRGTGDGRTLGFVLRWEPVKNTAFLEELFDRNEDIPDPYNLRLVTDLSPQQEASLAHPHLSFVPPMGSEGLAAFYASCDALVCPSLFESFGNVPAEAVAAGTPALVSATTGVAEVFRRAGLERLIVSFESADAVLSQLAEIIRQGVSPEERSHLHEIVSEDSINKSLCEVVLGAIA
jgi:glycosyltransferase involved in cell wall biosynthesis